MNGNIESLPPHKRSNQLRVCYKGVLTEKAAQEKIGRAYRVLEIRPAQCFDGDSDRLVPATEVIFDFVRRGGIP